MKRPKRLLSVRKIRLYSAQLLKIRNIVKKMKVNHTHG